MSTGNGVSTTNIGKLNAVNELIGNSTSGSGRIAVDDFAKQLVSNPIVSQQFTAASEGIIQSGTWAGLFSVFGTKDFQPGRVIGPDTGTHTDASSEQAVPNEGEYRWSASLQRWIWVSQTVQSQINQEIAERIALINSLYSIPGVAAAWVDENYFPLWVQANDKNGGPTDYTRDFIVESVEEVRTLPENIDVPGIIKATMDPMGFPTWDIYRESDGEHPEWVIAAYARRLMPYFAPFFGQGAISDSDQYLRNGEVFPILADTTIISGWGSSSIQRSAAPLAAMASEFGVAYYSGANSGTRSEHTCAQFGSIPALLTVEGGNIPASGGVTVTSSNMPAANAMQTFAGTLGGVQGALSSVGAVLTFTRSTDGEATPVAADTPFIPLVGPNYRATVALLWMGKNNLTGAGTAAKVIQQTDATFDWLSPFVKRCLVFGHFCDRDTPAISAERDAIYEVNGVHKRRYGRLFIDIHSYVTGSQIWIDMGLTPTQADLDNQAIGNIPPSLAADNGHLTPAAYAAVVQYLVRPLLISLGWFQETV